MRVILLKDIPKLGKKHEVREVSDGHALNFLVPRGLVEVATASAVKRAEAVKKTDDEKKKIQEDLLLKNLEDLEGVTVEMSENANELGHLFAGIHKQELVPAIKSQTRLDISPEYIEMEKPIKEVGEHEVTVKIKDKSVKFKVLVKAN